MKLSIIIVSYNVSAFLENCLSSVFKAIKDIQCEVLVVDNHSVDDTIFMIRKKFPTVKLIENKVNSGFAVANNQGIDKATGKYILLLNPDTIVSEDCFEKCISFMEKRKTCGALGVKMYDGSGAYLPESKRGFPSPFASFTKMTGLYRLFPRSKLLNQYYLGHLDSDEVNQIEVLTGAFFFIRSSVFDIVDKLDEAFFMYGEDIDLSYRIEQAGYEIFYLPTTNIIHFKGESTKKGSLDYVKTFYQAMIIFAQKHFQGTQSWIMVQILKMGIYFAAFSSFVTKKVKKLIPIAIDIVIILCSILVVTFFWSRFYYQNPDHFDHRFYQVNLPVYAVVMLIALYIRGAYHKYAALRQFVSGIFFGTISILIIYALLPLSLRSSRIVILLAAFAFLLIGGIWRILYLKMITGHSGNIKKKRVLFVGNLSEYNRIREMINRSTQNVKIVGALSIDKNYDPAHFLNDISELEEVARINSVDEIIFSSDQLDFSRITKWMSRLGSKYGYKIASQESWQIIGSASKNLAGEFYGVDIEFKINDPFVRKNKRLLDIVCCCTLSILSPLLILKMKNPGKFYSNLISVLAGSKSWVGYQRSDPQLNELPSLKDGVVEIRSKAKPITNTLSYVHNFNYLYAKDYRVWFDLEQIILNLNSLDKA